MNSKQVVLITGLALGLGDFLRRLWRGGGIRFRYYAGSWRAER